MSHKTYMQASGIIFLIVAAVHLWRAVNGVPVAFGTTFIPMWASWVAVVVAGTLSYHALRRR